VFDGTRSTSLTLLASQVLDNSVLGLDLVAEVLYLFGQVNDLAFLFQNSLASLLCSYKEVFLCHSNNVGSLLTLDEGFEFGGRARGTNFVREATLCARTSWLRGRGFGFGLKNCNSFSF
jgi:hypothetical protein